METYTTPKVEIVLGGGSRGWNDAATGQEMPGATSSCKRQGVDPPLQPPEGVGSGNTVMLAT